MEKYHHAILVIALYELLVPTT